VSEHDRQIRRPSRFVLCYSEQNELPYWVPCELTARELSGTMGRTDNFRADPAIPTGSTALRDYRGSGFDRGHLTPVADMKWSQ